MFTVEVEDGRAKRPKSLVLLKYNLLKILEQTTNFSQFVSAFWPAISNKYVMCICEQRALLCRYCDACFYIFCQPLLYHSLKSLK